MDEKISILKPYVMSLSFSSIIFLSYMIVDSGFKNLHNLNFKANYLWGFLLFLLVIYYLLRNKCLWNPNKKIKNYLLIMSLVFSVLNVLGTKVAYTNTLFSRSFGDIAIFALCIAGYFISFYGISSILIYIFSSGFLLQSADSVGQFCGAKRTRCGASGLI